MNVLLKCFEPTIFNKGLVFFFYFVRCTTRTRRRFTSFLETIFRRFGRELPLGRFRFWQFWFYVWSRSRLLWFWINGGGGARCRFLGCGCLLWIGGFLRFQIDSGELAAGFWTVATFFILVALFTTSLFGIRFVSHHLWLDGFQNGLLHCLSGF